MDIETILMVSPKKLPGTPKDLVSYLMMDEHGRAEFNKHSPGFWHKYDNPNEPNRGFFSEMRMVLGFNMQWIAVLKEELKSAAHAQRTKDIVGKIKEFYREMYVGPMIGGLPFFAEWKILGQAEAAEGGYNPNEWTE